MGARYRLSRDSYVFREETDGGLLLDRRLSMFFKVNAAGATIIKLMEAGLSRPAILSRLYQAYEIPNVDQLIRDFGEFESLLIDAGLASREHSQEGRNAVILQDLLGPLRIEEFEFIQRNIPEAKSRVIDVGCGEGIHGRRLGTHHDVIGVDVSINALKGCAEQRSVVIGDALKLPFGAEVFDVALVTGHVLGYVSSQLAPAMLTEISRVVKRGGQVITGVWTDSSISSKGHDLVRVRQGGLGGEENCLHFFSEDELPGRDSNLRIVDTLLLSRSGDFGNEYVVSCYRRE